MEDQTKSIVGCILFGILILVLGVGGYFYTFKDVNHEDLIDNNILKIENKYKIDKNKKFIYYNNEQIASESLKITYRDPKINLDNTYANSINEILKKENEELYNSIEYISDKDLKDENGNDIDVVFDNDNIYSAIIRNYNDYQYNQYISLVVLDYKYDCFKGEGDYISLKSYVFDVNENKRISNLDVFTLFNTSLESVKEKIKNKLLEDQSQVDGEDVIKVEETLLNLANDNTYALFINEYGELKINFIVKSSQIDYNDSIIIYE